MFLKVLHEDADSIGVILPCLFQVNVVLGQIESLILLALACPLLLGLTLQYLEALLHELNCSFRGYGILLVDGSLTTLHMTDHLLTVGLQRLQVRQV